MTYHLKHGASDGGSESQSSIHESPLTSSSRLFVSLNLISPSMRHYHRRHRPLTRQTAKVLIRLSVGMFLALLLFFLVVYTVILVYVDKHFNPPFFKSPTSNKKLKFKGRLSMLDALNNTDSHLSAQINSNLLVYDGGGDAAAVGSEKNNLEKNIHRKQIWDSSLYITWNESLPQCKWQTLFRVLITSAPAHFEQRKAIRLSWCDPSNFPEVSRRAWACIFLVGGSKMYSLNAKVREEKATYQDMLIGDYLDSYRNLTLKIIHGFNFSVSTCPSSYLLKTDDDCFVNAGLLHSFLLQHNTRTSGLYAGNIIVDQSQLRVVRGVNRWSVSKSDFPDDFYPPYASGMGYILSTDVAHQFVVHSRGLTPIPNEDAFVGIIMSRLNLHPTQSSRFQLSAGGLDVCNYLYVFVVHHVSPNEQRNLTFEALRAPSVCNYSLITDWS